LFARVFSFHALSWDRSALLIAVDFPKLLSHIMNTPTAAPEGVFCPNLTRPQSLYKPHKNFGNNIL
jgi:hypothetical protein